MNKVLAFSKKLLVRRAVIVSLLILVVTGFIKWHGSLMPESAPPPYPPLPSPNARDYINQAVAMVKDGNTVSLANGNPEKPDSTTTAAQLADPNSGYHVFSQSEKDALVAENIPAFKELETGLHYPYGDNPKRSMDTLFTSFAKIRSLARTLSLAAKVSKTHGQWDKSMNYSIDCMAMGEDLLQDRPVLISSLVGIACDAIGRRQTEGVFDHLTAQQAEQDARRIEQLDQERPQPWESLEGEKEFTEGSILEIVRQKNWRRTMWESSDEDGSGQSSSTKLVSDFNPFMILLSFESPKEAYNNYTDYMDQEIAVARLPWPDQIVHPIVPTPTDPMSKILLPIFDKAIFKVYTMIVMDRMIEQQLALQAYKANNGRYPQSLNELVPKYLSALPIDPFSSGAPYKYSPQGSSYLLYSIGPDAVDNGGQPLNYPESTTNPHLIWESDEKGDIVAGINR